MIRRARWAIATVFFVNGLVIASWVPHIPAIKGRHALGDGELGLVLLAMAAGSGCHCRPRAGSWDALEAAR